MFVLVELSLHTEQRLVVDLHEVKTYFMAYFQAVSYRTVLHQGMVISHAKLLEIKVHIPIIALDNVA